MHFCLKWVGLVIIFLQVQFSFATKTDSTKKYQILPLPAFGYTPETKTYLGAVCLVNAKLYKNTRPSNFKLETNYTWNKQWISDILWNYFSKQEKWIWNGEVQFSKFPDFYYGIGNNTPDTFKTTYQTNRWLVENVVLKNIKQHMFLGVQLRYRSFLNLQKLNNNVPFAELQNANNFGIGPIFMYDTRNSLLKPIKGYLLQLNTNVNKSKSTYVKVGLDSRIYKSISKNTLAIRFAHDITMGNAPFYDLAFLGGDRWVRGYYNGRFRDKNLSTLQTEFRFNLYKWFGATVFGGISNLYANNIIWQPKPNIGAGLRFKVDKIEGTNLRFDFGIGIQGNNGFYVSYGEAF